MGKLGDNTVRKNVNIPKCESLQYCNQDRNPISGTREIKDKGVEDYLKRNHLEPGNIIFSDQY